jgi:hypothetical protein
MGFLPKVWKNHLLYERSHHTIKRLPNEFICDYFAENTPL